MVTHPAKESFQNNHMQIKGNFLKIDIPNEMKLINLFFSLYKYFPII